MFRNTSIRSKLLISFSLILALMAGLAALSVFEIKRIEGLFHQYRADARETVALEAVELHVLASRLAIREYLSSPTPERIAVFHEHHRLAEEATNQALLLSPTPEMQQALTPFKRRLALYREAAQKTTDALEAGMMRAKTLEERTLPALETLLTGVVSEGSDVATVRAFILSRDIALLPVALTGVTHLDQALAALPAHPAHIALAAVREDLEAIRAAWSRRDEALGPLSREGESLVGSLTPLIAQARAKQDALGPVAEEAVMRAVGFTGVFGAGGVLLGLAVSLALGLVISRPIQALTRLMERVAADETNLTVPHQDQGDELGAMARTVEVFRRNVEEKRRLTEEAERARLEAEATRRKTVLDMADRVESSVGRLLEDIQSDVETVHDAAQDMAQRTDQATATIGQVLEATTRTTQNVETVASATEELGASSQDIGTQAHDASRTAREAADKTRGARTIMASLEETAERIGAIITLITDIATQTNLLALNATIEAARAGEAGKGFAVVAGEVKSLATATTRATEDIRQQIEALKTVVQQSTGAFGEVGDVIERISENAATIAGAVSQQTAAINEVARNTTEASGATRHVADHMARVSTQSHQTRTSAQSVATAADTLVSQTTTLQETLKSFILDLRRNAT